MYHCPNTSCVLHNAEGISFDNVKDCPVCKTPLVLISTLTDFQQEVLNKYPYVIAFPYKRMLEEADGRNRLELLNFTFHNILKYLGLISASEYFQSTIKRPNLNTLFREKLFRPSIGLWNEFVREAIKELKVQNHSWIFPELTEVYEQMETGKKVKRYLTQSEYTNEEGQIDYKETNETAIGTLINFRNRYLGHGAPLFSDAHSGLYKTYSHILEDLLLGIKPLAEIPMLKLERFDVYSLMGTTVAQLQGIQMPKGLTTVQIWLQEGARVLGLLPFYVLPGTFAQKTGKSEVFVYEQNTSKRIVFFSPESEKAESEGEVLERLNLLLSIKEKESPLEKEGLSLDAIRERAQQYNKKTREGLIKEKKILEGIYQNRQNAEAELRGWVGARAGLFFISATAGAGKTNLLNYIEGEYPRLDACPLFLRASRICTPDLLEAIREALNVGATVTMEDILQFFTQESPLMVLVDGGNEHPKNIAFLQSIVAAVQSYRGGSLKVVLTWRANTPSELPVLDNLGDELYASITNKGQEQLPAKHALLLNPMDRMEVESAWETYINHPSKKYSPKFTLADLDIADRPLSDQLSNPLLLKMFLELFNGKTLKQKGEGFADIWALWWGRLSQKEAHFLKQFALLIIEKDIQQVLLDDVYTHPHLKKDVEYIQVDSPFQQLTYKGILSLYFKDNLQYVSFSMEAMMHQALAQVLIERNAKKDDILTLGLTNEIWEAAVTCYFTHVVKSKKLALLYELIRVDGLDSSMLAAPLADALMIIETREVLNEIIKEDTEREWAILHGSLVLLASAQQNKKINDLSALILSMVLDSKQVSMFIIDDIFDHLNNEQKKKALDYYERGIDVVLKGFGLAHPVVVNVFFNIGMIYNKNGDYSKALEYYEKGLESRLSFYGSSHPEVANVYFYMGVIHNKNGDYAKALECCEKCLEVRSNTYGLSHPDVASAYNIIGVMHKNKRDYSRALEYYEKGRDILLKTFGSSHRESAKYYENIGIIHKNKGEYSIALELYERSLEIYLKTYGSSHKYIAIVYNNIAEVYKKKSDHSKALEFYEKSLEIRLKSFSSSHPEVGRSYFDVGVTNKQLGNVTIALEKLLLAYQIIKKGEYAFEIGDCYEKIDDMENALKYYVEAVEINKKGFGIEANKTQQYITHVKRVALQINKMYEIPEWML